MQTNKQNKSGRSHAFAFFCFVFMLVVAFSFAHVVLLFIVGLRFEPLVNCARTRVQWLHEINVEAT